MEFTGIAMPPIGVLTIFLLAVSLLIITIIAFWKRREKIIPNNSKQKMGADEERIDNWLNETN